MAGIIQDPIKNLRFFILLCIHCLALLKKGALVAGQAVYSQITHLHRPESRPILEAKGDCNIRFSSYKGSGFKDNCL